MTGLRQFFTLGSSLNGTTAVQIVLWAWTILWFIPLAAPWIHLFDMPLYENMAKIVSETAWAVVTGILVFFPFAVDHFVHERRLRLRIFILGNILRAAIFAFAGVMFWTAAPMSLSGPNQLLMSAAALWVVWRLSDELYR